MKIGIIGAESIGKISSALTLSLVNSEERIKQLELINRSYHKLKQLMNGDDSIIKKGIDYFKKRYTESPFKYPGTNVYTDLLIDCAKIGMTIKEAYKTSIAIIDYEFDKLNEAYANGEHYIECYDFEHPILKVYIDEFQKVGLSAAKAGESLAELCKTIEELPKEQKSKYKSWERPYRYHP